MNNINKLLKILYKLVPFKKELFSIIKLLWTPPRTIYRHLYFKGIISIKIDSVHKCSMRHYGYELENELFWIGIKGWEKVSFDLWKKLCSRPGNGHIFDIGANTGIYTLIAKSVNTSAVVFALEPVERVFKKLESNIALNKMDVTCLQVAASNYDGEATIYDTAAEHVYSVTVNQNRLADSDKVVETTIRVQKLDSIIKEYKINKISLMKIDVETHEAEVLAGFANHLERFMPTLLIEILNDEVAKNVEKIVEKMGYLYFNIDENKGITRVKNITKSDYYNFLLCAEDTARYLQLI